MNEWMKGKEYVFIMFLFLGWIFMQFTHPALRYETLEISASGYGSDLFSRRKNMLNGLKEYLWNIFIKIVEEKENWHVR